MRSYIRMVFNLFDTIYPVYVYDSGDNNNNDNV